MWRIIKNSYHLLQAVIANIIYGFPSKKMHVIAITGTDGKTTTANLIYHILSTNHQKVALISTISAKIAQQEIETGFHTTTPSSFALQKLISHANSKGTQYLILETTSHALDQYRVWGISPDIAIYTNITPEHLDYHKTFTKYLFAKAKLGLMSKNIVLNSDDPNTSTLAQIFTDRRIFYYGKNASDFNIDWLEKNNIKNIASFNQYNYLAAGRACSLMGFSDEAIANSIRNFSLPLGRWQILQQKPFTIIVDFAHTPNALNAVLSHARRLCKKNLIHVYGSAGLRDKQKRFAMGLVSTKYSDLIILTEEDYRTEDLNKIFEQIELGTQKGNFHFASEDKISIGANKLYTKISARSYAIDKALSLAQKDDIVLITGKGHEKTLARGKIEYPWNDIEYIEKKVKKNRGAV